jgi:CRP/FNR family transcriptional regulator
MSIFDKLTKAASLRALRKLADDENYQFIKKCHHFQDVGPEALVFLLDNVIERRYRRHEAVFKEGNPGICLFLVRSGRVEIFKEDENGENRTPLAMVGEGRVFGEVSVLSVTYRSSSARAVDAGTTLLTLSSYDIDTLMDQHPHDGLKVLRGVTDTLAHNLLETNKMVRELQVELRRMREAAKEHGAGDE